MSRRKDLILLVETRPAEGVGLLDAIERAGVSVRVDILQSVDEALEYLRAAQEKGKGNLPSLLMLDLGSVGPALLNLLVLIRQNETYRPIPIIVFTSIREKAAIRAVYTAGANSCIIKSKQPEEMYDAVACLLTYWFKLSRLPV